MGMYTQLTFNATLKKETPEEIIDALHYMISDDKPDEKPASVPKGDRVGWMFNSGGSYYFGGISPMTKFVKDDITNCWMLFTSFNIKNYDDEIESFLTWIKPWIKNGAGRREMYAMVIYEESLEPTFYYLYED